MSSWPRAQAPATRAELVSLAERIASIRLLRAGTATIVLATAVFAPQVRTVSLALMAAVTGAYLLVVVAPDPTTKLRREHLLPVIGATLLVDGIYLAWVAYATGGAGSPLRFLIYVHVVAVTLLGSYRTGLKVAAWHSLLFFVTYYAQRAGIIDVKETLVAALPGPGSSFQLVASLHMAALWSIALGTATFAATGERELRAQKIDLEQLSKMVAAIDEAPDAADIPRILLDRLCEVFGFTRGIVLASPRDQLDLVAFRGPGQPPHVSPGMDPIMEEAWNRRQTMLVRQIDPASDPRLAALIPGGRNLFIVPLFLDAGQRLGVVVLEHRGRVDHVKQWIVLMVDQFASHAALALHNAWLLEELRNRLEENRALRGQLLSQNFALEAKVEERTRELSDSLSDLRMMDEQRRKLMTRLVTAEEEERRRIAAQIHDGPIQEIVVAGMKLERLKQRLEDPEQLAMADTIWGAVSRSVEGLRNLLSELRPAVLDQEGLEPALQQYLADSEVEFEFEIDNRFRREPSADTRITLYRIAQEALANVRKHAGASSVEITMEERDGGFTVRITDDGVGFNPPELLQSAPGHLGLTSMRERAEMAGGRCEVRGLPGGGTTVEYWIPAGGRRHAVSRPSATVEPATPVPAQGEGLEAVSA